ncbi:hypothetical protein WMY93_032203 [Mugilogobius chulae]|uniref:B30.2/SPRY domain-containing protein n=1 Tax=Mugilogobius chulae TaxID=88201 RepID=A0AAW0MEI9_9GOBI
MDPSLKSAPCSLESLTPLTLNSKLNGCKGAVAAACGAVAAACGAVAAACGAVAAACGAVAAAYGADDLSTLPPTACDSTLPLQPVTPHCPLQSVTPHCPLQLAPAEERWIIPGLRKYARNFSLDPNTTHTCLLLSDVYARNFSLDPNTNHTRLVLSDVNQTSTNADEDQTYAEHEERFTFWSQVLGTVGLSGCCYWEVDWSGGDVSIAVSYKSIKRDGEKLECLFGFNAQSWSLYCGKGIVMHNNEETRVSDRVKSGSSGGVGVSSGRVGVFLDKPGGRLSFYNITEEEVSHIYTFNNTFTDEELFPGFGLFELGDSVSVFKL